MTTTATAAIQADVTVATIRAWCRIGAMRAQKGPAVIDLHASYTVQYPGPQGPETETITPTVKSRTTPDGRTSPSCVAWRRSCATRSTPSRTRATAATLSCC